MAAVNTGNNLLFLIVAAMLGFMAVSGIFGLRNLQQLELTLKFPDEIYCDIPAQLTLRLGTQKTVLPHYLLTLHLLGTEAAYPFLPPQKKREQKLPVTFRKRGVTTITKAAVTSPFPVNFFVRSNLYDLDESCLVFPKPLPLPDGWSSGDCTQSGSITPQQKGTGSEIWSICAYTGAEPLRQIHWKLSARHEELLVKELSAEAGQPVIINPEGLPGDSEARLGHAAFLINSLMSDGRAVGLQSGDQLIPPDRSHRHRLKLLGELARYAAA